MKINNQPIQPPKGFRDFLPQEAAERKYVIDKAVSVFERFGYPTLETPALEYASLLEGKYGEEEKLIFKFADRGGRQLALRYDQTVPLARIFSQYQDRLPLPFKRYQIQPSWRAEKPQAGRYREFTQIDFDIIGSSSPLSDAEIAAVTSQILESLGFKKYLILFNDRRLLAQIITLSGIKKEHELPVIRILDKLEKIGEEKVYQELLEKGISKNKIENLMLCLGKRPKLPGQKKLEIDTTYIESFIAKVKNFGVAEKNILFTPTLARGLDYYTGIIMEVIIEAYENGSVGGGGRYDNLIGMFASTKIPAVGLAFGLDRLLEALKSQNLLPQTLETTQVFITIFNPELSSRSLQLAGRLRSSGINTEVALDPQQKLSAQLKYANKKNIPLVLMLGPEEIESDTVILKNMKTGKQEPILSSQLADVIKSV